MSLEEERIKSKFRPVFRELKALNKKIDKKDGWIFIEHKYTIEELLDSKHHAKIDSYTAKIGDDIQQWHDVGKLSNIEEELYYLKRNKVEDKLEYINKDIENREPTWWEEVKYTMKEYIVIIMDNMPDEFKRALLTSAKGAMKILGKTFSSGNKLLGK